MTGMWALAGFSPDGDVDDSGGTESWDAGVPDAGVPDAKSQAPGGQDAARASGQDGTPSRSRVGEARTCGQTGPDGREQKAGRRGRRSRRPGSPPGQEVTLASIVAGNIRLEAARVGVTQADLARFLGMSRSAVSLRFTEQVDWRVGEVGRVAWYLSLPVADLFVEPRGS